MKPAQSPVAKPVAPNAREVWPLQVVSDVESGETVPSAAARFASAPGSRVNDQKALPRPMPPRTREGSGVERDERAGLAGCELNEN